MDYVFIIIILACGISDFKKRIIPNKLTIPLALICLLYQALQGDIALALVGFTIGLGIGTICFAAKGMGGGDVKLMAAIGAYLGAYSFLNVLFIASVISVIWGIILFLKNRITISNDENINTLKLTIPFGTCLSIAVINIYFYPINF